MADVPAKKDASSFKFEANISVFGTEVDLKPLEGDEIGYRAPAGEDGIAVSQTALIESGIIAEGGAASKIIPSTTYVKAIVFNKKTKKVEFAAKAMFYGPIKGDTKTIAIVKNYTEMKDEAGTTIAQDVAKTKILDFLDVRGIVIPDVDSTKDFATIVGKVWDSSGSTVSTALLAYKGFILNQYPKVFTVNSISVYVGPEAPKAPATT
jgi:hypothetical protein